jgi:flagellar motor protein MotB
LEAEQTALAEETTILVASLRQTLQQGLAEATSQSRAGTVKLQTQVADLVASLRQTFQQGLAEAASQSRADTMKLQTQVAEMAAGHKALLDRLSVSTKVPDLAFALLGVRTRTYGNSILLTFDDGLFLHGTCFKPDAKSRLQAVAKALAQVSTPLRIEVIGCADDDRVFRSWTARFEESLALERASAVVDYFIELGLFAPNRLAALSSRGTDRPFPSDTVQNRAKNRTAVLRISTEEKPMAGHDEPAP